MAHSYLYCEACGASNGIQATTCFVCGQPLHSSPSASRQFPHTGNSAGHLQGILLQQRYRIIGQVGKGGFGAVYKAADTQFGNRLVALKEMSPRALSPQHIAAATDAFKREAMMLAGLNHPNLPSIHDHFIESGHWYLVMDFIEGQTLEQYLNHARSRRLPVEKVLDMGIQLSKVLGYLHLRHPPIIFRDLKPSNVMLTPDGDIYLIDFGIARHFKPGQAKDTIAFGSPGYAAPEQYGNTQTTPRADIYSLGALLHQLLTGHDPLSNTPNIFTFPPLRLHNHPAGLEELIMQMLEMNPAHRPASMADVKQELQGIAAEETARLRNSYPLHAYRHPAVSKPPVGTTLCTYTGHQTHHGYLYPVTSVAWSPDGTRIASASTTIQVWHALTGDTILSYHGHSASQTFIALVAWSPDGTVIASSGGDDSTVQIWDAVSGGVICTYRSHTKQVNALAWSPDGMYIASASDTVQVWDATAMVSGAPKVTVFEYHGHARFWRRKNAVNALAWNPVWGTGIPDGTLIASGGDDKTVQVWDAQQPLQHSILTYRGHTSPVYALAWSPDGTYIASGSGDGTVQVWHSAMGDLVFTYYGHSGSQTWVNTVAWSPDGKRIASVDGDDQAVQVWDAFDGGNVFVYSGHANLVNALEWSPDGTRIASASQDGVVQVWQAI